MIDINDDNFEQALTDAKLPVLLIFKASFCGPSAWFEPMIDKAIEDYARDLVIVPVDIEENPKLSRHLQIKGTPTVMLLHHGEPVASRIGTMTYREFQSFIKDSLLKG